MSSYFREIYKFPLFSFNLLFWLSPILTIMHLRIVLYTYGTLLQAETKGQTDLECSNVLLTSRGFRACQMASRVPCLTYSLQSLVCPSRS